MNYMLRLTLCGLLSICGEMLQARKMVGDSAPVSQQQEHAYRTIATKSELANALNSNLPIFIKVYAEWCGACSAMEAAFNDLARKYAGQAIFIAVDFDNASTKAFVDSLGVDALPTIIIKRVGSASKKDLERQIRAAVGLEETEPVVLVEEVALMPVEPMPAKKSKKDKKKKKDSELTADIEPVVIMEETEMVAPEPKPAKKSKK